MSILVQSDKTTHRCPHLLQQLCHIIKKKSLQQTPFPHSPRPEVTCEETPHQLCVQTLLTAFTMSRALGSESIIASLYMLHVFLVRWSFDYTMWILFAACIMQYRKCFHLSEGFSQWHCPLSRKDAQWRQGSAPWTSHTQCGLKESRSDHRCSVPRPARAFHSLFCFFPLVLFSVTSLLKGGYKVKGALTPNTQTSLCLWEYLGTFIFYPLTCIYLINKTFATPHSSSQPSLLKSALLVW